MTHLNLWGGLSLLMLVGCGGSDSTPEQEPAPENTALSASAGAAAAVMGGTVVPLDGSESFDEEGDELTYAWTLDAATTAYFIDENGAPAETLEAATGRLLIPASQAGEDITVSLEVSDGKETASDSVTYSVEPCTERAGYVFTGCIDPIWQGPMAWDVNFLDVSESFGYYGGDTDNHVQWSVVEVEENSRGRVFDVTFNKENWNGSFRIVPAGRVLEADRSVDLSSYEGGNLVFDLRVVEPTDADIYVEAECIHPCKAMPRQILPATDGSWSTISIPLADFEGMDWSKTSIPLSIYPEWGAQTDVRFQVDNIRFESASCVEEENVIFDECLGPKWYTLAAVDNDTLSDERGEITSGNTDNHIQWRREFSGTPERGDILAVQFTSDAIDGHFYIRTESRDTANDMSAYINGALVFDINVQDYGASTEGIVVRVDTWWDGETSDEILLPEVPIGEWTTIEIPVLDLLVGGGLELSEVHVGFSLWPLGNERGHQEGVDILLDNIRWEPELSE